MSALDAQSPNAGLLAVLKAAQVARLLAASLVGRVPLASAPVALLLFARESWSIGAAGLLVGVYTVGLAVGGPVLARIADRWRQPPVMCAAVAVSTAGFVTLAAADLPLGAAAVAALLAGAGAPPFEAGLRVLWRAPAARGAGAHGLHAGHRRPGADLHRRPARRGGRGRGRRPGGGPVRDRGPATARHRLVRDDAGRAPLARRRRRAALGRAAALGAAADPAAGRGARRRRCGRAAGGRHPVRRERRRPLVDRLAAGRERRRRAGGRPAQHPVQAARAVPALARRRARARLPAAGPGPGAAGDAAAHRVQRAVPAGAADGHVRHGRPASRPPARRPRRSPGWRRRSPAARRPARRSTARSSTATRAWRSASRWRR